MVIMGLENRVLLEYSNMRVGHEIETEKYFATFLI